MDANRSIFGIMNIKVSFTYEDETYNYIFVK